jgi:glycosyltransferase domain-containing protein
MNNSFFPLLEKLTIIIPTYKRQIFAIRCMQYWSGKKISIIILDGSKYSIDIKILKKFEKNITYYHNPIGYYERILSAINLIKTEYVLMGCDDDFYIPSALNTCIKKLSENTEVISCCGSALGFDYKDGRIYGRDVYKNLNEINSLLDEDPNDRIKKHFLNYEQSHFYAVCRSKIWKIAAETIFSKEYSCYSIHELQFEFLLTFAGKSIIIPELMWLRSDENHPIRDISPSLKRSNTMINWWYDKKYIKEKESFITRMNNTSLLINEFNNSNSIINIEGGINYFLEFSKKQKNGFLYSFMIKVIRIFPRFFKDKVKKIIKNLTYYFKKKITLKDLAKLFKLTGIHIDFYGIESIYQSIYSFYKKKKNSP